MNDRKHIGSQALQQLVKNSNNIITGLDEVAAHHVDADAHYGHACMSRYVSIPIIRLSAYHFGVDHRDYPSFTSLAKILSTSIFVSNN